MRDDPKIFTGRAMQGGKSKAKGKGNEDPPPDEGGKKGDILIRDLWMQRKDSVHEMCVVNTDAVSCQSKIPEKCLETAEREKKKNHLHDCLNTRRHFTPFIFLSGRPSRGRDGGDA